MSTHNIPFQYKKEKLPLIILSLPLWDFFKGQKNEFETAVVDEPSVFEPPKFYCLKVELSFLYATHCQDLFNITVKYHDNIPKGFQVIERTRNCI